MDRNLAMEVVRVTEAAALASARLMGRGDNVAADQAAVTAMRKSLNDVLSYPESLKSINHHQHLGRLFRGLVKTLKII